MALTKTHGRQCVLSATIPFTFGDLDTGVITEAIDLPGGAYLMSGELVITTAFDSATSAGIEVGLLSGATNDLLSSTDAKSAGITPLVPVGGSLAVKDTITLEATIVGATAAGAGFLRVSYVIDGRATEVQP